MKDILKLPYYAGVLIGSVIGYMIAGYASGKFTAMKEGKKTYVKE